MRMPLGFPLLYFCRERALIEMSAEDGITSHSVANVALVTYTLSLAVGNAPNAPPPSAYQLPTVLQS